MKRARATNQTKAGESVRDRIVAVARREFFANGFRNVTMDDLAADLGVSKKTFYAHFPGKTELLKAVLVNKFDGIESDMDRLTAKRGADVAEMIHQMLACLQRHTEEIQPPFLRDIQRETPDMFRLVESRRRELIRRHWGKIFRDGRKADVIRKDIPVVLMIEILLGAVQSVVNPPKMAELGLTPRTGVSAIIEVVLHGVITPKLVSIQ